MLGSDQVVNLEGTDMDPNFCQYRFDCQSLDHVINSILGVILLIRAINYLDNGNRDGEHVNNNNKY